MLELFLLAMNLGAAKLPRYASALELHVALAAQLGVGDVAQHPPATRHGRAKLGSQTRQPILGSQTMFTRSA